MNEIEINKLRAAGFSDDEIKDYIANRPQASGSGAPTSDSTGDLPEVDVNKPSTTLQQAEAAGIPTEGRAPGFTEFGTAAGSAVADNAGKIAAGLGLGGGAYVANQWRKGAQATAAARNAQAAAQMAQAQAAMEQARAAQMSAQGLQERALARQAAQAAKALPQTPQILGPNGQPLRPIAPTGPAPAIQPVAPTAPAPTGGPLPSGMAAGEAPFRPPQQASILDKTTNMIRQLAANKVVQNMAKGGAGVAAALTPGNIGQNYNFPQTGPLRGSEINPQTGRPWTQQELAAYNQQYK